jgi:hypothetical protein
MQSNQVMTNRYKSLLQTIFRHKKSLGFFTITYFLAFQMLPIVHANMSSDNYIIQMGNFNITSGEKSSDNFKVTDTVGQTAPGQFGQSGYIVKSGFQYIYVKDIFAFSISNTAVNLGELTPGAFSSPASTILSVSASGAQGYKVYAYESQPLTMENGVTTIPDTTCDTDTCSETIADSWSNTAKPGFGFSMTGTDILPDFENGTKFKQFANAKNFEAPQVIMQRTGYSKNRQATVQYKAAIAGNQVAGNYENTIIYIATPGY